MEFYKKLCENGDIKLYVVDSGAETISRLTWDNDDNIRYQWDYGYGHLTEVEEQDEMTEENYKDYIDVINEAARIGTRPIRPF